MDKLNELFNAPLPWKETLRNGEEYRAEFAAGDKEYEFTAVRSELFRGYKDPIWVVEFRNNSSKDLSQAYSVTGDGSSVAVMSTVIDIMDSFIRRYQVRVINFSAYEPSRKKLYSRLIKTLIATWSVVADGDEYYVISKNAVRDPNYDPDTESLHEAQLSSADAKDVFKKAGDLKNKPSGLGRIFKGLRKDKIDVSDLQKSWADEGYPDDTRDIYAILTNHGFNKKEINKVFSSVFGKQRGSDEYAEPTQSPVIQKIAKYAKDNGIAEELKAFMASEYGFKESVESYGKAVVEDIREIFTAIVNEERSDRSILIRNYQQTSLGRTKK